MRRNTHEETSVSIIRDGARSGVHRACVRGRFQVLRFLPVARHQQRNKSKEMTETGKDRYRRAHPPALHGRKAAPSRPCGKSSCVRVSRWRERNGLRQSAARQRRRTNRWIIDFALPGSALRMRMGRTDYTSPDKEKFDSGGRSREPGIALYGKLSKNMSLSMFNTKSRRRKPAPSNDDSDGLLLRLWASRCPRPSR